MKKRIAVLFFTIGLVLSGCVGCNSATEGAFPSDKGSQDEYNAFLNKYNSSSSLQHHFVETEDTFYGLNGGRICYYDRQSGISGTLCPDPSCTHADESCGAYTASVMSPLLSLYGGKIYWLGKESPTAYRSLCLWRCDPDGTDHERFKILDFEKYEIEYGVRQWTLYDDKLFFEGYSDSVDGVQAGYHIRFGYLPLDSDEEVLLLDEVKEEDCCNPFICYLNGKVFYSLSTGYTELQIICFDLKNQTSELLLHTDDFAEGRRDWYRMWVTEDERVYIASNRALHEVSNGALVEKFALSDAEQLIVCLGDEVAVWSSVADGYRMVEVRDFDGILLYSGKLFPEPVEGFDETLGMWNGFAEPGFLYVVLGADREKIIVCMTSKETVEGYLTTDEDHVFLLDIQNNLKATHLWTSGQATMYEPD